MVKVFVTKICKLGGGLFIKKSELYAAYLAWCLSNNIKPVSQKMFGIYMIDIYKLQKNLVTADGKSRAWYGIDLINQTHKNYKVYPGV